MKEEFLTQSSINTLLTCQKKYQYRYVLGVDTSKGPFYLPEPPAMVLGKLVHEGLARYFGAEPHTIRVSRNYSLQVEIAKTILSGFEYAVEINHHFKGLKVIAVEEELGIETEFGKLAGKIDLIGNLDGLTWVIEHKTSGIPLQPYAEKYWLGYQGKIYFALAKLHGYDVSGVLIHHILTRLYRRKGESESEYAERFYHEITSYPDKYFRLMLMEMDERVVEEVVQLIQSVGAQLKCCEEVEYLKNPNSCNEYKRACEFSRLCMGEFGLEDTSRVQDVHPEIQSILKVEESK